MSKQFNIAIVGATGVVGEAMRSILQERKFPVDKLYLLASSHSAGKALQFGDQLLVVEDLADFDFKQVDIALFSAGGNVSKQYAPVATKTGCVVIDNTSHFRYVDDIPLVIPEVNPEAIADYQKHHIIANPNCSTIQMLVALKPVYDAVGITRINVVTYQAVSGSGRQAMTSLRSETCAALDNQPLHDGVYPQPIAFNVLPHIDTFQKNGYSREEMKMVWETRKIFSDNKIQVNPTTVRVPVFYGHSEAIHLETRDKITAKEAKALLAKACGVKLIDLEDEDQYPTPLCHAAGRDPVYVGRVREDISHERGLNLWVVADNVRKGAALNAIQIAEILVKEYLK